MAVYFFMVGHKLELEHRRLLVLYDVHIFQG